MSNQNQNADQNAAAIAGMSKSELVAAAIETGMGAGAAQRMNKAELAEVLAVENAAPRRMASQLAAYRGGYTEAVSSSGNKSLHNGDEVARQLAGMSPRDVVELAEAVLGMEPGILWTKYRNLNPGQQRMNSGNRIRNAIKRGDIVASDVIAASSNQ